MKKKLSMVIATLLVVQAVWVGAAFADYKPEGNIVVGVNLLSNIIKPSSALGNFTFNLQESAHKTITNLTGLSIDHSYAVVQVNGITLLAIDPPIALINKKK
ncbi:hypothetical protein EHS13_03320 [Paenibacillus psychroresistens]|uniref:Uncharacterized protein n=1 Tax=Paenibacillus psychroresistens TaxID=1778678 RepID=A0A6B8RF70_9BACL|nr:hypothetical protein [Paenibacillus psychroresistens]QGQ94006.1 hypothetical protein EHS13_03320 [Paenibacillus psychroresistens]